MVCHGTVAVETASVADKSSTLPECDAKVQQKKKATNNYSFILIVKSFTN
jgi:hypothetical protein